MTKLARFLGPVPVLSTVIVAMTCTFAVYVNHALVGRPERVAISVVLGVPGALLVGWSLWNFYQFTVASKSHDAK